MPSVKVISVRIPEELVERLDEHRAPHGWSRNAAIVAAIEKLVSNEITLPRLPGRPKGQKNAGRREMTLREGVIMGEVNSFYAKYGKKPFEHYDDIPPEAFEVVGIKA